jgi:CheY-like chemotaxis protein
MAGASRILVTDDDDLLRQATCDVLTEAGYQVIAARNGEELLQQYRATPTELVLCDLFMPGKDGLQAIPELLREFPKVKVIAMSGGGYQGALNVLQIARHLGAAEVLAKPFKRAKLLSVVELLLAS